MKRPFVIGDRVAVYSQGELIGPGYARGQKHKATIKEIKDTESLILRFDRAEADSPCFWHPKQCRLLKKKERRRIWVSEFDLVGIIGSRRAYYDPPITPDVKWIEFVEVKKK